MLRKVKTVRCQGDCLAEKLISMLIPLPMDLQGFREMLKSRHGYENSSRDGIALKIEGRDHQTDARCRGVPNESKDRDDRVSANPVGWVILTTSAAEQRIRCSGPFESHSNGLFNASLTPSWSRSAVLAVPEGVQLRAESRPDLRTALLSGTVPGPWSRT